MSSDPYVARYSDAAYNVLQLDVLAERAAALGHQGQLAEQALGALRAFDAGGGDPAERQKLVRRAARVVWAFFVQREVCGFRDQKQVIRDYRIPGEVLVRLGAIEKD